MVGNEYPARSQEFDAIFPTNKLLLALGGIKGVTVEVGERVEVCHPPIPFVENSVLGQFVRNLQVYSRPRPPVEQNSFTLPTNT